MELEFIELNGGNLSDLSQKSTENELNVRQGPKQAADVILHNEANRLDDKTEDTPMLVDSTSKDMLLGELPNASHTVSFIDAQSKEENIAFVSSTKTDITSNLMEFDVSRKHVRSLHYEIKSLESLWSNNLFRHQ